MPTSVYIAWTYCVHNNYAEAHSNDIHSSQQVELMHTHIPIYGFNTNMHTQMDVS